ncbi:hypothetical protein ACFFHM_06000 [Halalkalibacter kiskunsagensis]|uniref:Uncharacterized protein n=1 Tax=Halalkalibacter kiskunsagensis TaxID=1548599 RepID=A0ABV6KA03_9BACI
MGKSKTVNCSSSFDGKAFTGGIMLAILLFLLIFGSTDIEGLTDAPE